jgi:16S rRNA (cytosine967-C5)-methyltransferase
VGAYQVLFLRVPAHAAVDDAVEAVKRARGPRLAGFVNAVLRRLAHAGAPPFPPLDADPAAHLELAGSAPPWLVRAALQRFPPEEAGAFLDALNRPAPLWVRVNTRRIQPDALELRLGRERSGLTAHRSPLYAEALRLSGAGDLTRLPAFAEGLFTAQDLGAQLAARLCDPQPGERILDACAGVGGKATHLQELARGGAQIDAADQSSRKLELCADTARRLGAEGIRPLACDLTDPRAPLAAVYDRVLLDAPCSGLGVLRRHPEAKWRTPPDLHALGALQERIWRALAPRLRVGGVLVYSVCTFTDEEGPAHLAGLTSAGFRVEPPSDPGLRDLVDAAGAVRTWPHRHDADAFYLVRLRRVG